MFDLFESLEYSQVRLTLDPPVEVSINLIEMWPPRRVRWGMDIAMQVRNHGIQVDETVAGTATELVRTCVGDEFAVCTFTVIVGGKSIQLTDLVPRTAISPPSP